jgi:hypothetical protein
MEVDGIIQNKLNLKYNVQTNAEGRDGSCSKVIRYELDC